MATSYESPFDSLGWSGLDLRSQARIVLISHSPVLRAARKSPIPIVMRSLPVTIAMLSALIATTMTAIRAGEIRGNVTAGGGDAKATARYVVRGQGSASSSKSGSGQVAVAVEFLDAKQTPRVPDTQYVMAQENTSFVPKLLVVPLGARVTFPNRDAFFHNVFSYSPPRSFDLGRYPKGETRTVRFEESGIVRIFCEIHASMFATILVAPSDHYQIINSLDGFSFPGLPAGRYRVVAVDAAGRKTKRDLELKDDESATVSLILE